MIGEKKKKMIQKTKSVKDKSPEWLTFFQFPVKPPISALKLQVSVDGFNMGDLTLDEMPDALEVRKWNNFQGKKKIIIYWRYRDTIYVYFYTECGTR